ncbi:MAG: sulfatase-like hydrolase/transferase [Candidatus Eisenbacteria bacterium]
MASMKVPAPIVAALLIGLSCGSRGPSGPNLVLVTVDTLRRDHVGCYGDPAAVTPNWDRIAREGVLFAHAQSQVPITLPSHATIFTGLYPGEHGARHNGTPLPDEPVTLAERLSEAGYQTAGFVGSQVLNRSFRLDQGFAIYGDKWKRDEGEMGLHGLWERPADRVTDAFAQWFHTRDRERPFFAWVHYYDPHAPFRPPPPFAEAAGGGYAGETAFVDREIGHVLDVLEEEGILDGTVLVVMSDHGEGLGEHGETEHGVLLYETTLEIPWTMRYPSAPRGRIVDVPVGTEDLLPTLAGLLPIRIGPSMPGRDLGPVIEGGPSDALRHRPLYAESYYGNIGYRWAPLFALRLGDWKLVRGARDELFHLADDPEETTDIVSGHPDRVKELGEILEGIRERDGGGTAAEADLTTEQREMLEGLGYVAPRAPRSAGGDLPDPRDRHDAHEKIIEARVLAGEGRRDLAKAALLGAIRIDPENTEAMLRLAPYFRESGELEEEIALYRRILEIEPDHGPAWNNLGVIREIEGRYEEAIECYDRAIAGAPLFPDAYANRGNARFALGDSEAALADHDRALELDSGHDPARIGRALVFQKRGNLEALVRELQLALRSNPDLEEAREWLRVLEQQQRGR